MKKKSKSMKRIVCFMLSVLLCIPINVWETKAATVAGTVPITCYTRSTGRVYTYKSVNGSYSGYIDGGTDQCIILQIYSSGWVRVKYPIYGGYKEAYTKSSNFFVNTNFSTEKIKIGENKTVYRQDNLSSKLGTVYASDNVIIVGNSGNKTQIIYPVSGGYKLGWISGVYSSSGDKEVDIANGYYQIKSAINSDYVIDVYGASTSDGANVQLYKNNGGTNQGFIIKKEINGYYSITAIHSNKKLDVYGEGKANGTNIIQCHSHLNDNQLWKIYKTSDGYYSFKSKCNDLFIDVIGAVARNETNIQCHTRNTSAAQKFILQPVTVGGKTYEGESNNINEKRNRVISYMNAMATVSWTPTVSFRHWSGGRVWQAGKIYKGIPYSQSSRNTTLELFAKNLSGEKYIGPSGQSTYLGSDCSSAVSMAWQRANSSFRITSTYRMFPKESYIRAVGNYKDYGLVNSKAICQRNGLNVMKSSYSQMKPGDALLQTEHVMLVTGVYNGYVTVTHQTTYDSTLCSTWRVNQKITFDKLYSDGYIPITLNEW